MPSQRAIIPFAPTAHASRTLAPVIARIASPNGSGFVQHHPSRVCMPGHGRCARDGSRTPASSRAATETPPGPTTMTERAGESSFCVRAHDATSAMLATRATPARNGMSGTLRGYTSTIHSSRRRPSRSSRTGDEREDRCVDVGSVVHAPAGRARARRQRMRRHAGDEELAEREDVGVQMALVSTEARHRERACAVSCVERKERVRASGAGALLELRVERDQHANRRAPDLVERRRARHGTPAVVVVDDPTVRGLARVDRDFDRCVGDRERPRIDRRNRHGERGDHRWRLDLRAREEHQGEAMPGTHPALYVPGGERIFGAMRTRSIGGVTSNGESGRGAFRPVLAYFVVLYVVVGLGNPATGIAQIPIQFLLKDGLKLGPSELSWFQLVVAAPLYVAFLFGFLRDRWSPFGLRDRGYFIVFGPLAATCYTLLVVGEPTYPKLIVAVLAVTAMYRFLSSSISALTAVVGQERGTTGRLSMLINFVAAAVVGVAALAGGWLQSRTTPTQLFVGLAALTLAFLPIGLWRPAAVYGGRASEPVVRTNAAREIGRFLRHAPLRTPSLIWLLWCFAPGFGTPLLFHLTNTVKATSYQYGLFMTVWSFSFLPTYVLYAFLCKRFALRSILFWSTLVAIPQMVPLLFIRSPEQAIWLAAILGLTGGVATAAYMDLLLRACPKGLEGTGIMMADTGYFIAVKFGDLFGAWLYERGGFALATWVTTGVYALILVVLRFVPRFARCLGRGGERIFLGGAHEAVHGLLEIAAMDDLVHAERLLVDPEQDPVMDPCPCRIHGSRLRQPLHTTPRVFARRREPGDQYERGFGRRATELGDGLRGAIREHGHQDAARALVDAVLGERLLVVTLRLGLASRGRRRVGSVHELGQSRAQLAALALTLVDDASQLVYLAAKTAPLLLDLADVHGRRGLRLRGRRRRSLGACRKRSIELLEATPELLRFRRSAPRLRARATQLDLQLRLLRVLCVRLFRSFASTTSAS